MKFLKSSVSLLPQEEGIIGMYRHIERVGRVCYKSSDAITDDSWKKFIKMLYNRGHHAVFNLGTVYLDIPKRIKKNIPILEKLYATSPYTKWTEDENTVRLTTNFRVICQLGLHDFMKQYWTEPGEKHYHRVTADWTCSRAIAMEILRHRVLCPVMESTRYVNYGRSKFGSELTYIIPQWIYKLRDEMGNTLNPYTLMPRDYLKSLEGQELWDALVSEDPTVKHRNDFLKMAEEEYMYEITEHSEGIKLKAEEARGVLPQDTKCELCTCGYISDWNYINPNLEEDPEKAGFFYLRCAPDAHPDIQVLAKKLKEDFINSGIDNLL